MSDASLIDLTPVGVAQTIAFHEHTGRAVFIWGSPGVGKSAGAMQVASKRVRKKFVSLLNAVGVAFIDVRLSMYAPTDVIGMPYRVEENGETVGVAFSPPKIMPRDLDLSKIISLKRAPRKISFHNANGKGSNGIHYVREPKITVTSLEEGLTAEILEESPDHFVVRLVDQDGKLCEGEIQYTVTGEAEAIVAFEEMNSAPLSTQQAAYQFILDRRVGEYIVPRGVQLIAMGNHMSDKGVTYVQPTPLANRFVHCNMVVSFDEWQEWAIGAGIHPLVIGYLNDNQGEFHNFNPTTARHGFQTPRSWHAVSDMIHAWERDDVEELRPVVRQANICGAIGDGGGSKFMAFLKISDKLPRIETILNGTTKQLLKEHRENVSVAFSVVTSTCYMLRKEHQSLLDAGISSDSKDAKRKTWYSRYNNVIQFWMDNFQAEIQVMGMRANMTIHNLPPGRREQGLMPAMTEFIKLNKDLITY